MTSVGFTGSRAGVNQIQTILISRIFVQLYGLGAELHQGVCIGADAYAARKAKYIGYKVVGHPATTTRFLSTSTLMICDEVRPAKEPIDRNHDIVDESVVLVGAPGTMEEVLRSGTWATIRYARKKGKRIYLVLPNGTIKCENCDE